MPRAINRCPRCGATVTPFAAGCAVCGLDLEQARAQRAARRRIELPRPHWSGGDGMQVAVAFLLALFVSPIGLLLTLYWANQRHQRGDTAMMIVMLAAAALALAALVAPVWFWRHVYA
jgi:hypothetical protein